MSEVLNIVAIATAISGQEGALRAAQQRLVADTLKEPGCLRFELTESLEDARVLVFIETWASETDWRAHMQGGAIKRFQASGAPRLIQDFTLLRLRPVAMGDPLNF
jgi:quinol monooxygenase YgiN